MPLRNIHLKFDEYLKNRGVIHGYTFADTVHDRMDRDVTYWGPEHRDIDFYHQEEGIREWLKGFQHLAYQELCLLHHHQTLKDFQYSSQLS